MAAHTKASMWLLVMMWLGQGGEWQIDGLAMSGASAENMPITKEWAIFWQGQDGNLAILAQFLVAEYFCLRAGDAHLLICLTPDVSSWS